VLLGNHRDAWVFGAADASSGTAAMMELSRVLGEQLKKGQYKSIKCRELCHTTEVKKEIVIHFHVSVGGFCGCQESTNPCFVAENLDYRH